MNEVVSGLLPSVESALRVRQAGMGRRVLHADGAHGRHARSSATALRRWPSCSRCSTTSRFEPPARSGISSWHPTSRASSISAETFRCSCFLSGLTISTPCGCTPGDASTWSGGGKTRRNIGVHTTALVQGDALGGGLESALLHHTVICERGAQAGFPRCSSISFPEWAAGISPSGEADSTSQTT